jgi:hypothetical protein
MTSHASRSMPPGTAMQVIHGWGLPIFQRPGSRMTQWRTEARSGIQGEHLQFIQDGNPFRVNYRGDWGSDTEVLAVPKLPYRKGGPDGPINKGWWSDPARVTVPLLGLTAKAA